MNARGSRRRRTNSDGLRLLVMPPEKAAEEEAAGAQQRGILSLALLDEACVDSGKLLEVVGTPKAIGRSVDAHR